MKNLLFGASKQSKIVIKKSIYIVDMEEHLTVHVDNSSSSHADNRKNKFLILREGPAYGINESLDH